MNCGQVHKKLIPYINGELTEQESRSVAFHLDSCKSCSALYAEVQATFGLIEKRKRLEPDPFLYTRIRQRIEEAVQEEGGREKEPVMRRVLQPVLVAAMLAFAVFSGVELGNAFVNQGREKIVVEKTTAYYLNDLQQEKLEMAILNE